MSLTAGTVKRTKIGQTLRVGGTQLPIDDDLSRSQRALGLADECAEPSVQILAVFREQLDVMTVAMNLNPPTVELHLVQPVLALRRPGGGDWLAGRDKECSHAGEYGPGH